MCRRVVPTVRTTGGIMACAPKMSVLSASFNTDSLPPQHPSKLFTNMDNFYLPPKALEKKKKAKKRMLSVRVIRIQCEDCWAGQTN